MRNSLQAAFKTGQGPVTPEPSGTGFSRPPSMASSLDASGSPNVVNVAMKADELCESVSVDIAEQGQALHTQTSAVKLDISPMLSVDIRPSPAADAAEPAELHVSERLHSDDQSQADPLVAVRLSIVPETVGAQHHQLTCPLSAAYHCRLAGERRGACQGAPYSICL